MTNQNDHYSHEKIRADFLLVVESYLHLYPTLPNGTRLYFEHAIKSHIHTATVLGWPDIADKLLDEWALLTARKSDS